jgi:riboflavin-specific deaminase-like protein
VSLHAPLAPALDQAAAWRLLRALVERARSGVVVRRKTGLSLDRAGALRRVAPELGAVWVDPDTDPCFGSYGQLGPAARHLLELYLPLCIGDNAETFVIAHLGQSLDGQIATSTGASRYITGRENLDHIHRLRALTDAVVVGAETVERDDPQLTTRLVEGDNPARVVIDPTLRVSAARQVYSCRPAPTYVVCARAAAAASPFDPNVRLVEVDDDAGKLDPGAIIAALRQHGLRRVFVEGGGVTVSRFVNAGVLNRLHVTVSPMIVGAGRPGLALPPIDVLEKALRPRTRRFDLGDDVLFDCELDRPPESGPR